MQSVTAQTNNQKSGRNPMKDTAASSNSGKSFTRRLTEKYMPKLILGRP